jgi:GNAT superfamily N-acetyltransferase
VTSIAIRLARAADADQIGTVFLRARAGMAYLPAVHTDEQTRRFIATVVRRERVHIALADGTVVGFAAVHEGWLNHLYLDPGWHGRGIGSALLRVACDGMDDVQLWVFQRNEGARRFYERRGFLLAELTDGAGNEEHEPDARYRRLAASPAVRA